MALILCPVNSSLAHFRTWTQVTLRGAIQRAAEQGWAPTCRCLVSGRALRAFRLRVLPGQPHLWCGGRVMREPELPAVPAAIRVNLGGPIARVATAVG